MGLIVLGLYTVPVPTPMYQMGHVQANVGLSSDSGLIYCAAANGRDGSGGDMGQAAFREGHGQRDIANRTTKAGRGRLPDWILC
jgi:hypothetical protein